MDKYGHRSSDGGIDPLDVPGASGRLWMCGKHAIGPDVDAARRRADHAQIVVCLVERHELVGRYDDYVSWLDTASSAALWRPTPDLHVGDPEATAELRQWLQEGSLVVAEEILTGLDRYPEALQFMFDGGNLGKLMVKV